MTKSQLRPGLLGAAALLLVGLATGASAEEGAPAAPDKGGKPVVTLTTSKGVIKIELDADKAASYAPGIAADLRALAIIAEKTGDTEAAEDYYRRAWLAWNGAGRTSDAESARQALEILTGRPEYLP